MAVDRARQRSGTLAEPVVPLPGMVLLGLVVMVLAATTGAMPVRAGLRHRPADVLRTESTLARYRSVEGGRVSPLSHGRHARTGSSTSEPVSCGMSSLTS